MRIISGRFGGQPLSSPSGRNTRPTSARARAALFAILHDDLEGAYVADFFAGTGALGLESLSRGAASADFYESERAPQACLRKNIESLGLRSQTRVITSALPQGLGAGRPYDLIFVDPPWGKELELQVAVALMKHQRLAPEGTLVIECPYREPLHEDKWAALKLELSQQRRYGDTEFRFYVHVGSNKSQSSTDEDATTEDEQALEDQA